VDRATVLGPDLAHVYVFGHVVDSFDAQIHPAGSLAVRSFYARSRPEGRERGIQSARHKDVGEKESVARYNFAQTSLRMLREASDDPLVWKKLYKKQILQAHAQFAQEAKQDWRIYGQPDARLRVYCATGAQAWRAQGILYCGARSLLALWKDLDFERRTRWGDLFFAAPHCDTVLETFFTQTLGEMSVARCKDPLGSHRLFWVHEDAAASAWTVMSVRCQYRAQQVSVAPAAQWTHFGPRCYVRLVAWNEPPAIYESLVTQMAACETFCRDTSAWSAVYSPEAMVARDLELRK
jgi:hypothetical protein